VTPASLGIALIQQGGKNRGKGKAKVVQNEISRMEEVSRQVQAISMNKQGRWTKWDGTRKRSLSWNDIWSMEPLRLSYLLKAVYDVLPTPTNLLQWRLTEDPGCKLCGKPSNLEPILRTTCQKDLTKGW
jgi:hypothetical protein